jgi:hypothetical protein
VVFFGSNENGNKIDENVIRFTGVRIWIRVMIMIFNTTFNNISVIS